VVKVAEPVGKVSKPTGSSASKGKVTKVSASTSSKASKAAAESHPKTAASAKKGN
jgi:membrane-bound lytic murein transglycosylase D